MNYHSRDYYTEKAMKEGKRARSYYKLKELDQKFSLFSKAQNIKVLDLGCAPGSWCQYALEKMTHSLILGIDLKKTASLFLEAKKKFNQINLVIGNVNQLDQILAELNMTDLKFDLILSDMAPNTSGNQESDSYLSYQLVHQVSEIVKAHLTSKGKWIAKYLEGAESDELKKSLKIHFHLKIGKPKSTKKKSREIFLIGESK